MSMGKQLQAIYALGPLLVGTLVVDWASLGTLMGAYWLAVIVMALPVGIQLARFCRPRGAAGGRRSHGVWTASCAPWRQISARH